MLGSPMSPSPHSVGAAPSVSEAWVRRLSSARSRIAKTADSNRLSATVLVVRAGWSQLSLRNCNKNQAAASAPAATTTMLARVASRGVDTSISKL